MATAGGQTEILVAVLLGSIGEFTFIDVSGAVFCEYIAEEFPISANSYRSRDSNVH